MTASSAGIASGKFDWTGIGRSEDIVHQAYCQTFLYEVERGVGVLRHQENRQGRAEYEKYDEHSS